MTPSPVRPESPANALRNRLIDHNGGAIGRMKSLTLICEIG